MAVDSGDGSHFVTHCREAQKPQETVGDALASQVTEAVTARLQCLPPVPNTVPGPAGLSTHRNGRVSQSLTSAAFPGNGPQTTRGQGKPVKVGVRGGLHATAQGGEQPPSQSYLPHRCHFCVTFSGFLPKLHGISPVKPTHTRGPLVLRGLGTRPCSDIYFLPSPSSLNPTLLPNGLASFPNIFTENPSASTRTSTLGLFS